jgi:aminoglycoside phosphotransferase (APT) family kinase protein
MDPATLAEALRTSLQAARIEGLAQLSGGASRETWAFDAVGADGSRTELVLRRDPPGRPSEPGAMGREARTIRSARAAGLAVPEVLAWTNDQEHWGSPGLIMRRVTGETIARRILRDDAFRQARRTLVAQLGEFAAGLHALPVSDDLAAGPHARPVPDDPATPRDPATPAAPARPDPLAELRAMLGTFEQASPTFDLALRTLEADPPPHRRPAIVHGDFRLGNLIVGPQSLHAVIDWELVHAGNPVEDLGWLCVKAWRFGVDAPVAGLGSREELLAAYRSAGGADIGLDELRWWEIFGTLRWGVICLKQAWTHLSGAHRSVELAAIGRRVCEQEWDLLLLLAPEAAAEAALQRPHPTGAPQPSPAPHGRPTASELLDAVRGFLTDDVIAATTGQVAFHARVAANVIGIVAREIELGEFAPVSAKTELGEFAPVSAETELAGELARSVAAKLAVANPRYFKPVPHATD